MFGRNSAPRAYASPSQFSPKPNGYAAAPGTGPSGESCGTCMHCRQRTARGKHFYKCARMAAAWGRDRASDIVLKSPACRHFEAGTPQTTTFVPRGEVD